MNIKHVYYFNLLWITKLKDDWAPQVYFYDLLMYVLCFSDTTVSSLKSLYWHFLFLRDHSCHQLYCDTIAVRASIVVRMLGNRRALFLDHKFHLGLLKGRHKESETRRNKEEEKWVGTIHKVMWGSIPVFLCAALISAPAYSSYTTNPTNQNNNRLMC